LKVQPGFSLLPATDKQKEEL